MMSVSSVSGRGLAALLLVATLAVAARAADVGADASATLLNTADSADGSAELSVDSGDSSDMDLFRGRALLQGVPRATPEPPTEASRFYYKGFKSYKTKYAPCGSPKPTYTPKPKPYCKASSFCTKCAAGEYSSYYDKYCAKWCCGKTYYSCVETTEMEAMCTE